MAGGKRKVFNRKTRNKRQNETENTEQNSSAKALRNSSSQGKKLKLEETKEGEEKRSVSVQDLTTEPTTLIKPKLRDDDVSRKASKYVPPFSRTRKSGSTEEESGNKSPVTRSSTRKRNLLQVLTDVAKQKLEFEDRNDENSSLMTSEKTADSDRIKEEQKETLEVPPAKHPKLKERVKINRHFSLNLRGKGKKKTKQNESEIEEEEVDGNAAIPVTLEENEMQETKVVEKNYEKKHQKTTKEALEDETKQNESESEGEVLDGNTAMEETMKEEKQETKVVEENYETKHHKGEKEALKDETKQNESEPEGEVLDGNAVMEEKMKEERQETKVVEKKNKKSHHENVDEEPLKDEIVKILIKENKLKRVPDEDSQATCHPNDGLQDEHSKCSIDNNLGSKKENKLDLTINKPYYIEAVVQACVDYLIQTIEVGIPIDVVPSDNIDLAPGLSIKADSEKKPQAENEDDCAKISSNHINDESINGNLEYSKSIVSKNRQVNADQEDHSCLEDGVGDRYKAVHADATTTLTEDKSNVKTTLETTLPRSSEIVPLCIHAAGENNSSLKKPEAEGNDDSKTVHGVTEATYNYGVQQKKELDTEVYDIKNNTEPLALDVIVVDDDRYQEKELETDVGDGGKAYCSDIDVVGDDENDVELLVTELHDGGKANLSRKIDVVADGDIDVKHLGDKVNAASKANLSDDIGDDDIDLKHLGDEEHAASNADLSDDIGDIDLKHLGDEEHKASKADLSDDIEGDIDLKHLGDKEHAVCKADLSEDIDVVGVDDHAAKLGNPLQLECATDVGVSIVVHSERIYAKFSDNHMDYPATVSIPNKENHVSIINPGGREDDENMGTKTSPNEINRSRSKTSRITDTVGYTATCQMDVLTAISSTDGKIMSKEEETHSASLEVSGLKPVKILSEICEKDRNKCTNKQERSAKEKFDNQEKSHIIQEKECSVVNKECDMSGIALSKCREMDLDYVIDCTDSQLIGAKPSSVSDGLRYDDLNLEDLMDCSDSQLVDIDNLESQALNNQRSARDGPSQALVIEDGTTLIQDLIKEVSSIKLHLMDVWNRYEQAKKRRHLPYTPVIKKRK